MVWWGNSINTDWKKIFFFLRLFPLDNWKCCFRSLGTFIVRKVIEMMNLQMLQGRVIGGEPQHLDRTVWDRKFCVASRIVILISLLTICEFFRNLGIPAHHMLTWGFYGISVSKLITAFSYNKINTVLSGVLIVKLWQEIFWEYYKLSPVWNLSGYESKYWLVFHLEHSDSRS